MENRTMGREITDDDVYEVSGFSESQCARMSKGGRECVVRMAREIIELRHKLALERGAADPTAVYVETYEGPVRYLEEGLPISFVTDPKSIGLGRHVDTSMIYVSLEDGALAIRGIAALQITPDSSNTITVHPMRRF